MYRYCRLGRLMYLLLPFFICSYRQSYSENSCNDFFFHFLRIKELLLDSNLYFQHIFLKTYIRTSNIFDLEECHKNSNVKKVLEKKIFSRGCHCSDNALEPIYVHGYPSSVGITLIYSRLNYILTRRSGFRGVALHILTKGR